MENSNNNIFNSTNNSINTNINNSGNNSGGNNSGGNNSSNNNNLTYKYNSLITPLIETKLKYFLFNPTKVRGNSNELKEYKAYLPPLSEYQKNVLIGLILGDASLQKQSKNGDIRVKFDYSKGKHEAYAHHVAEVLRHWILTSPTDKTRKDSDYVALGFQTISHPEFNFLGDLFLQDGKKGVVPNLRDYMTPEGLAYWFMDDGGRTDYSGKSNGIEFHTGAFSIEDVKIMATQLQEKFGFAKCWQAFRNYPIIRISSPDYPKVEV